jgi:hypothetical protein
VAATLTGTPAGVLLEAFGAFRLPDVLRMFQGIVRGVAKHDQELIVLTEPRCMLTGSPSCTIVVRRQTEGGERSLMSRTLGGAFVPTACPNPSLPSRRGHPLSLS